MLTFIKRFLHKPTSDNKSIVFKTTEDFFEMQCKFANNTLNPQNTLVGMVLESYELGDRTCCLLKITSDDGGFNVIANTINPVRKKLCEGNLILWTPQFYQEEKMFELLMMDFMLRGGVLMASIGIERLKEHLNDERSRWYGLVIAKVAPEITNNQFSIIENYIHN